MKLPSRRILPQRSNPHHHLMQTIYPWLLCVSLSLYLFFSSSISSFLPSPQTRRILYLSSTSPSFKIYVYDLPQEFNRAWLSNPRCASHLFAAEVALHEAVLHSSAHTADPQAAHLFFVPVYVSCNFSTSNGFPCLRHASPLLSTAVNLISNNFPFWNQSNGADHIFVASHDFGACFHAMEDEAMASGVSASVKNSIVLQTFGVNTPHPCQEVDHVLIPPYVPPKIDRFPPPESATRDIFVFFRGKMEVHPKNVSGHFYSRRVRSEIWSRYRRNHRFYIRRHHSDGYLSEIARSVFCLCPRGWAPWSPRLVESVALGCVPVIIADGIRLPFPKAVPWEDISVTVAERDIAKLEAVLDRVATSNLSAIQRRLWDPAVRRALLFHRDGVVDGDATWHVLRALEGKVRRR